MTSRATAERWNRTLKHFRFAFAQGGHANDLDTLSVDVRYDGSFAGLEALFGKLELPLVPIPPGAPRLEFGRSYRVEEWRALPRPMPPFPDYADPQATTLYGVPAHASVHPDRVAIVLSGTAEGGWTLTESDFRNALRIEAEFERRGVSCIAG